MHYMWILQFSEFWTWLFWPLWRLLYQQQSDTWCLSKSVLYVCLFFCFLFYFESLVFPGVADWFGFPYMFPPPTLMFHMSCFAAYLNPPLHIPFQIIASLLSCCILSLLTGLVSFVRVVPDRLSKSGSDFVYGHLLPTGLGEFAFYPASAFCTLTFTAQSLKKPSYFLIKHGNTSMT